MIGKNPMMTWAPAPSRPIPTPFRASRRSNSLGERPLEHEDKITAIAVDAVVGLGSAHLAWGLNRADNRWATFWWVATGIAGVKFLHDLSRP